MTFSAYNDESGWAIVGNGMAPPIHLWQTLHLFTQLIEDPEMGLRVLQCGACAEIFPSLELESGIIYTLERMLKAPCMRLVCNESEIDVDIMIAIDLECALDQTKLCRFMHMARVAGLAV